MKADCYSVYILLLLSLIALIVSPSCQPNATMQYAKQRNLPDGNTKIVSQLPYDANTKALVDELSAMPIAVQNGESALNYLRDVAKDWIVTDDELIPIKTAAEISRLDISHNAKTSDVNSILVSAEARNAYDSLKSYSDEAMRSILEFGLDGDIPAWVAFNSALPKDVAEYDFRTKLGIQDKKLTPLKIDFLNDREKYNGQMLDYYISEISHADPELADKIKSVPYFKTQDVTLTEALEDIDWLASNPEYKETLEKIYGKGIERKMWPVALERLVYKAFNNEFDINNPLEGQDLTIETRLADFQAKYNAEMDQDGVPGPKPAIRGINLLNEPLGNPMIDYNGNAKTGDDLRFDYALIKWVLRCNSVRLYCNDDYDVFPHVSLAQSEGLDIWLLFFPLFAHPYIDKDTYRNQLADIITKANDKKIDGLYIGAEFDAWWGIWGGINGIVTKYDVYNDQLKRYIDDLVAITRQNYGGQITYQEWDPWYKFDKNVNWSSLDMVSASPYIGSYNKQFLDDQLYLSTFQNIKRKYGKPLIIAEVGSLTISESDEAGGVAYYMTEHSYHYDQGKQAQVIDRHLRLLFQAPVDGIFFFEWDEPIIHPWGDMNKYGFGIWDYGHKEPKSSFWTVYKYYKE